MHNRVAFLRAVNVGGRQVSMAALAAVFETLGFENVKTLLASGNVLFKARRTGAALERLLESETSVRLKIDTAYFTRTAAEMAEIVAENPFPREAAGDPGRLVAVFLKEPVSRAEAERWASTSKGPEAMAVRGRHAYVYYPNGQGESRLKIPWLGTGRNWNTVTKITAALAPSVPS